MTMEILKVQDLCKTYGKGEAKVEALKKVSFSLDKRQKRNSARFSAVVISVLSSNPFSWFPS